MLTDQSLVRIISTWQACRSPLLAIRIYTMWNRTIKPAVIVAFVSGGIAHMILDRPKPFGTLTLNNSPLDENGADFPCKQRL
jgi:hypothetical protein